jgi:large subunit ribosomal protein L4
MKLSIKDLNGNQQGELEVKFPLVEDGRGTRRSTTPSSPIWPTNAWAPLAKTMGEVSGTGKKPRQKGTGRARPAPSEPSLGGWRRGFGPKPRDFGKKVNARTKQLALRKALTERLKAGDVQVVSDLKLTESKTKAFISVLGKLGLEGTALVVDASIEKLEPRNAQPEQD